MVTDVESHWVETEVIKNSWTIAMGTCRQGFLCTCVEQLPMSDAVDVYIHCGYHGDWTHNDTQTGL